MSRLRGGLVKTLKMFFALTAVAALMAGVARADEYPSRPIRVIVGFAAGGGNDLFARLVMRKFDELTGATTVIENKPGAGGRISSEFAAKQPADGYTVLVAATGQMAIAAAIFPDLSYHPTKSFIPLNMIAHFPLILVVAEDSPAKSVKDLVAFAKANPDKSNYGTSAPPFTIASELLKLETGMPGVAIPFKGTNESNLCVISHQCLFTISDGGPAVPLIKGGKTRALAVTGAERSPELLDVPSMAEVGYPEVNIALWSGVFVPTGTPAPIVAKLEKDLGRALADVSVQEGLKKMAVTPGGPVGADFGKIIDTDIEKYKAVVQAAHLTFQ
jgi:tripartite-type tricarboxylate transporter receptor subunit TctC